MKPSREQTSVTRVGSSDVLGVITGNPMFSNVNHPPCLQTECDDNETKQSDADCFGLVISQHEQMILKNLLLRLLGNSNPRPSSELPVKTMIELIEEARQKIQQCELETPCAMTPNGQKLRRPEPNVSNNPKTHSQIGSANEGLPPALC